MEGYSRAAALTGAAADDAARQWVYYRAYRAVYLRLSTNPESVQFEDAGGHRYGEEQAPRFLRLANQARGEFDVLLSRAADSVLRFQQGSRAVPTVFEW